MKHLLRVGCFFLFYGLLSNSLLAQTIGLNSVTINPTAPLNCDITIVTANGVHGCINTAFSASSHSITGTNITIDYQYTLGPICLPALAQFMQPHTVGNIPTGTYTLTGRYFIDGNLVNAVSIPLVVGSCCATNSSFTASATTICLGDSIMFTANDTTLATYDWKIDGVSFSSDSLTSNTFTAPGTYTISLFGDDGSCGTSTDQTITVVPFPKALFPNITVESCPGRNDGAIDLDVIGGAGPYSYQWSNGDTIQDISQLSGGTYTVLITNSAGCSTLDTATVQTGVDVVPQFFADQASLICQGDTVTFTDASSGATQFRWFVDTMEFSQSGTVSYVFDNHGMFDIILVAANSTCTDTASQLFTVSAPPVLILSGVDPSCPTASNGSIDLQVVGGIQPYAYHWAAGDTTEDLAQIMVGTYAVTVTDSLGCVSEDSLTLQPGPGAIASFTANDTDLLICAGDSVQLTNTSTGATDYQWWSGNQPFAMTANASFTFTSPGAVEIALVALDSVCTDTTTLAFTVTSTAQLQAMVTPQICPDSSNGAIDITVTGGTGPFTFDWSNGGDTEDISGLDSGMYMIIVSDSAGCIVMDTFELDVMGGLSAAFDYPNSGNEIQFSDLSDSNAVSWIWDFGDGGMSMDQHPMHTFDLLGAYIVCLTASDSFGCMATYCDTLTIDRFTGIDLQSVIALKVYPNPFDDRITLELPDMPREEIHLAVFDALGRRVYLQKMIADRKIQLDLLQLAEGMYQLVILGEDRVYRAKLIKE